MPSELLLAPVGAGKTEYALNQLHKVIKAHPFAPVWVLLPGRRQEDALRQRLVEGSQERRIFFNRAWSEGRRRTQSYCSRSQLWLARCFARNRIRNLHVCWKRQGRRSFPLHASCIFLAAINRGVEFDRSSRI